MENKIEIRRGTHNDLPTIHRLVGELAEYENEAAAFTATLEDYENDFAEGIFETLVAVNKEGQVVGMTLYYMTYSTWKGKMLYLEDFVVNEAYRRTGTGQLLFNAFLDRGRELGCRLTKWQVLDWNEPAIRFYEKNNATIEKNWWNVKANLQ